MIEQDETQSKPEKLFKTGPWLGPGTKTTSPNDSYTKNSEINGIVYARVLHPIHCVVHLRGTQLFLLFSPSLSLLLSPGALTMADSL